MYGIKPERNFFVNSAKNSKLKLEWTSDSHGNFGNTSFVIYDSILISSSLSGRVSSFDISTGKKIGELNYNGEIEQTPLINGIRLVFIVNVIKEKYSTLFFYDLKNGKEIISINLPGKFNNEMIIVDNNILLVSDFGDVYKFSTIGTKIWKTELNINVYSNPAADKKHLYIPSVNGEIIKLDLENGNKIISNKITESFQSGIILDDISAYIGDTEGYVYSINNLTNKVNWSYNTGTKIIATPSIDSNSLYIGNLSGELFSLQKSNGELHWSYKSKGLINSPCLVFENILFQPNLFMRMDIFDKYTGTLINQINYESRVRTTPTFYKDKLYIGVDKGQIFCYTFVEEEI